MRQTRKIAKGASYHVVSRINHQEMRLDNSAMKMLFLDVVKRAKAKFDFRIENFTVMGNHFHLIIKPENESNLSQIMQWILGVFTMKYNRIHHLKGHLWQDRFFSKIITSFRELISIFNYIDENPVKAGLVSDPRKWRFGGIAHRRLLIPDIIAPIEPFLALIFPAHQSLRIG